MKSISKAYFVFFLLSAVVFCSCKKYLDKKSNSGLVVPTTIENFQAILDNASRMNLAVTPSFSESSADDYFLLTPDYNASFTTYLQDVYIWKPADYNFGNDWDLCYHVIYNSNLCLDELKKIPLTSQNSISWKNVKGSALFFRSFYFMQLAWEFAKPYDENTSNTDLGIVLRLSSDYNIPSARASVKDSYQQIINDAKEAVSYLPDNPLHPMRPSKAAAYGLLARTYLSMRQYDSAWRYADLCLQIKNELIDYNGDPDINGSISDGVPFKVFNKEVVFHSTMNGNYYLHNPAISALTDSSLYSLYDNNDLRKIAFFNPINGYFQFKGNYNDEPVLLFTGIASDEMYLIRAECFARKGDKNAALQDLNTLLAKRYDSSFVSVTANDSNEALARIILERRKELLMRGLRWIDIKRLNKENANISLTRIMNNQTYTLQPNANYYALPLPTDIINLSGMPQNPE